MESAAETSKIAQFQTKIVRVINDEDVTWSSNSVSCYLIMETILKEAKDLRKLNLILTWLKDPSQTKVVTEELHRKIRNIVLSQQREFDIMFTFIRVIQGLLIVLSSQAIVVAAGL